MYICTRLPTATYIRSHNATCRAMSGKSLALNTNGACTWQLRGTLRGLLETEKPHKKSLETGKPQDISSKAESRNKNFHWQNFGSL